jgi:hypothetical protein
VSTIEIAQATMETQNVVRDNVVMVVLAVRGPSASLSGIIVSPLDTPVRGRSALGPAAMDASRMAHAVFRFHEHRAAADAR